MTTDQWCAGEWWACCRRRGAAPDRWSHTTATAASPDRSRSASAPTANPSRTTGTAPAAPLSADCTTCPAQPGESSGRGGPEASPEDCWRGWGFQGVEGQGFSGQGVSWCSHWPEGQAPHDLFLNTAMEKKKWLQKHVLMLYQFAASCLIWWHRNCHQVKAKISVISVNLTLLYHSQSVSIWAIDEEDSQSVNHPTIPCATETVRVERLYLRGCSNSNKIYIIYVL